MFKKLYVNIVFKIRLFFSKKSLSEDGESITKWEENYLKANNWKCPNCKSGKLYEGPSGGMSTNIRCTICGQGYNVSPFGVDNIGIDEKWINKKRLRSIKLNKIKNETTRKN
jgi:hypothetical protein